MANPSDPAAYSKLRDELYALQPNHAEFEVLCQKVLNGGCDWWLGYGLPGYILAGKFVDLIRQGRASYDLACQEIANLRTARDTLPG